MVDPPTPADAPRDRAVGPAVTRHPAHEAPVLIVAGPTSAIRLAACHPRLHGTRRRAWVAGRFWGYLRHGRPPWINRELAHRITLTRIERVEARHSDVAFPLARDALLVPSEHIEPVLNRRLTWPGGDGGGRR